MFPLSYQSSEAGKECALKVKHVRMEGETASHSSLEHILTDQDNVGTSRRDQTYAIKLAADTKVKTLDFSDPAFLLAELVVYWGNVECS